MSPRIAFTLPEPSPSQAILREGTGDGVAHYVSACIQSELNFLEKRSGIEDVRGFAGFRAVQSFLKKHMLQFWWSAARVVGLGFLHDGRFSDFRAFQRETLRASNGTLYLASFEPWTLSLPTEARPGEPRLLIDVTSTIRDRYATGIQRVVKEIAKRGALDSGAVPVIFVGQQPFSVNLQTGELRKLIIRDHDSLILLDSTWISNRCNAIGNAISCIQANKGRITLFIYDIIALRYPSFFPAPLSKAFQENFNRFVPLVDDIMTISAAAAADINDYIGCNLPSGESPVPVKWCQLGAELTCLPNAPPNPSIQAKLQGRIYFLCVGTVEPRKGHSIALDAFERLWASDVEVSLVIMGAKGWAMGFLEERIAEHPEIEKRLFRFDKVADRELVYGYRHAAALIMPTLAEGFGLPVIEAASLGCPVIASDIPVLREIGGDSFYYFEVLDDAALAVRVEEILGTEHASRKVLTRVMGWSKVSKAFFDALR